MTQLQILELRNNRVPVDQSVLAHLNISII